MKSEKKEKYSIRKFKVGVGSALIGVTLLGVASPVVQNRVSATTIESGATGDSSLSTSVKDSNKGHAPTDFLFSLNNSQIESTSYKKQVSIVKEIINEKVGDDDRVVLMDFAYYSGDDSKYRNEYGSNLSTRMTKAEALKELDHLLSGVVPVLYVNKFTPEHDMLKKKNISNRGSDVDLLDLYAQDKDPNYKTVAIFMTSITFDLGSSGRLPSGFVNKLNSLTSSKLAIITESGALNHDLGGLGLSHSQNIFKDTGFTVISPDSSNNMVSSNEYDISTKKSLYMSKVDESIGQGKVSANLKATITPSEGITLKTAKLVAPSGKEESLPIAGNKVDVTKTVTEVGSWSLKYTFSGEVTSPKTIESTLSDGKNTVRNTDTVNPRTVDRNTAINAIKAAATTKTKEIDSADILPADKTALKQQVEAEKNKGIEAVNGANDQNTVNSKRDQAINAIKAISLDSAKKKKSDAELASARNDAIEKIKAAATKKAGEIDKADISPSDKTALKQQVESEKDNGIKAVTAATNSSDITTKRDEAIRTIEGISLDKAKADKALASAKSAAIEKIKAAAEAKVAEIDKADISPADKTKLKDQVEAEKTKGINNVNQATTPQLATSKGEEAVTTIKAISLDKAKEAKA